MCCVFVLLLLGFEFDMMKYLKSLLSFEGNQPLLKPWAGVLFEYSEALFESIRLSCGWKLIKAVFWRYPHCFTGGEKIKKKSSSHYGNEAPYLFLTSAKWVFHHLSFERRLQFGLLMSFWFLCQSNKPLSGAQVSLGAQLSIITSISSSQSERRPTSVSRPPLSLAGSEM